jgi:hypothetical protein
MKTENCVVMKHLVFHYYGVFCTPSGGLHEKLRITKTESFCDRVFFGHNPVGIMSGKLKCFFFRNAKP